MTVFVRVVQAGSLSAAAKELDLSPSAVSKLIKRLERRLGTALLLRSTRTLALTPEGQTYLASALRILEDIDEAEQAVGRGVKEPRGLLRVNTSVPFGVSHLLPVLPEFRARYPGIDIDLSFTDAVVDIARERVDVVVRAGRLSDSSFKARRLGRSTYAVVASPAYLRRHGTPQRPSDLRHHVCAGFNFRRSVPQWPFIVDGQVEPMALHAALKVNNGATMLDLTRRGLCISRLGRFHAGTALADGTLVEVLDAFNPGDVEDIHAIFASTPHLPARVRAFVDFLVEAIPPRLARA